MYSARSEPRSAIFVQALPSLTATGYTARPALSCSAPWSARDDRGADAGAARLSRGGLLRAPVRISAGGRARDARARGAATRVPCPGAPRPDRARLRARRAGARARERAHALLGRPARAPARTRAPEPRAARGLRLVLPRTRDDRGAARARPGRRARRGRVPLLPPRHRALVCVLRGERRGVCRA